MTIIKKLTKKAKSVYRTLRKRISYEYDGYDAPTDDVSAANQALKRAELPIYSEDLWRPYRYKVLYGGRGAARSWTFARMLVIKAAQSPLRILCTREIQASLKDSVHRLLQDQIELLYGRTQTEFKITDREIRHSNGSLFLFAGLRNNITKIKSLEAIDICWVEEAERVTKESWRVLIPTIRKAGSEIWISFNPDQETDATWQRFVAHHPPNSFVLKVNWDDNPWFPEELRAEMEYDYSVDPESAEHVWGGALRQVTDAQILRGKWIVQDFVVPTDSVSGHALWSGPYQGMDFGFGDPFAATRSWVHDDVLYISDEAWALKLDLHKITDFMDASIPAFDAFVTRGDSSRPDSISYLRKHGLPYLKAAKKGPNSVEDGIAHLRHYKKIVIHSRCKRTIDEFKRYSYKVDPKSGEVLFGYIVDAHNHLIDCLRYSLEPLTKAKRNVRALFSSDAPPKDCPECYSLLPDDGECPHCGWNVADHSVPSERPDDVVIVAIPADNNTTEEDVEDGNNGVVVLDLAPHKNGNGNGNGNGAHPPAASSPSATAVRVRRTNFRGLNG